MESKTFLSSMRIHMPELLDEVEKIAPKIDSGDSFDELWNL